MIVEAALKRQEQKEKEKKVIYMTEEMYDSLMNAPLIGGRKFALTLTCSSCQKEPQVVNSWL